MFLGGVLLLLFLGRQEASSLPSDPIFQNQRPRFLDRRQIYTRTLTGLAEGIQKQKDLRSSKTILTKGTNP
jgi:hypothetical protein